jgi:hypothetical protein
VGSGRPPQEAEFTLVASVPAGTYHVECDAVITASVDVTFSLIWRHADHAADTVLATWQQHFDPRASGFDAQPYEIDEPGVAIDAQPGDQFVFRYEGTNTQSQEAFIPNGDGASSNGRIPAITLPQ